MSLKRLILASLSDGEENMDISPTKICYFQSTQSLFSLRQQSTKYSLRSDPDKLEEVCVKVGSYLLMRQS